MGKKIIGATLASVLGLGTAFTGGMVLSNTFKDENYSIVLAEKQEDMDSLASSLADLNKGIKSRDEQIKLLQSEKETLRKQYEELLAQGGHEEELQQKQQRITELEGELAEAQQEAQTLRTQFEQVQGQYNDLNTQYQELLAQSNVDKQQIQSLNENISSLNDQITQLNARIQELESAQPQDENAELRNTLLQALMENGIYVSKSFGNITLISYHTQDMGQTGIVIGDSATGELKKVSEGYTYEQNIGEFGDYILVYEMTGEVFKIHKQTKEITHITYCETLYFANAVIGTNAKGEECIIAPGNSIIYSINIETNESEQIHHTFTEDDGNLSGQELSSIDTYIFTTYGWEKKNLFFANNSENCYRYENGEFVKCFTAVSSANRIIRYNIAEIYDGWQTHQFVNLNNFKEYTFSDFDEYNCATAWSSDYLMVNQFGKGKISVFNLDTMIPTEYDSALNSSCYFWGWNSTSGDLMFIAKDDSVYVVEMRYDRPASLVHTFGNVTIQSVEPSDGSVTITVDDGGQTKTYIFNVENSSITEQGAAQDGQTENYGEFYVKTGSSAQEIQIGRNDSETVQTFSNVTDSIIYLDGSELMVVLITDGELKVCGFDSEMHMDEYESAYNEIVRYAFGDRALIFFKLSNQTFVCDIDVSGQSQEIIHTFTDTTITGVYNDESSEDMHLEITVNESGQIKTYRKGYFENYLTEQN